MIQGVAALRHPLTQPARSARTLTLPSYTCPCPPHLKYFSGHAEPLKLYRRINDTHAFLQRNSKLRPRPTRAQVDHGGSMYITRSGGGSAYNTMSGRTRAKFDIYRQKMLNMPLATVGRRLA